MWAHDYHLISFGAELRALGAQQRLGFFLHIPFPPPELLQAVPAHNWLVEALFQFDVIGFQTTIDLGNFRRFVAEHVGGKVFDDGRMTAYGRTIIARSFPIGIDVDDFAAAARTPEAASQIERLNRRTIVRSHIIGVDRLDYTKGLPERFQSVSEAAGVASRALENGYSDANRPPNADRGGGLRQHPHRA